MTKQILHLHLGKDVTPSEATIRFLDETFQIRSIGTGGEIETIIRLIKEAEASGQVDAIALDGMPTTLRLGTHRIQHSQADAIEAASQKTPLVSGAGVRSAFERWAVRLINEAEPGFFTRKAVLFSPGLNHNGLIDGIAQFSENRHWAEPVIYYNLPAAATNDAAMRQISERILDLIHDKPFRRIFAQAGEPGQTRTSTPFDSAQIIVGDVAAIRRYAPKQLPRKIVVVECASLEDQADLQQRGVATLVTTMPSVGETGIESSQPARWSAAVIEACMASLLGKRTLKEGDYLNQLAELDWKPAMLNLQAGKKINSFAFVIHPLSARQIFRHPILRHFKWLPHRWVEFALAYLPPMYVSRIKGIVSASTGQEVQGYLYTLGTTPRQMMQRDPSFTYRRLEKIAKDAEERGARLMGLGAFTSIVGDAGVTTAHHADIAVTSGNSLTVAATLETAKQAVIKLGAKDLTKGKAMVIGATGSIGSVCSRLIAQAIHEVTLVAPRPERLIALKRQIEEETPAALVTIATSADDYVGEMDVIITTTSAFGQRVIDITKCKPGAVICDVARPPDIEEWEAALRPDVLVIESGEILLPGDPDFGFDIGLPPKTAYACLSETALLAMEGRFEDYSIGRELELEKVKDIYKMFKKHGLRLAGMRSFDKYVSDADLEQRRILAEEYRANPQRFHQIQRDAQQKLRAGDGKMATRKEAASGPQINWKIATPIVVGVIFGAGLLVRKKK